MQKDSKQNEILDILKEYLNSLLKENDRIVLYTGMYIDLSGNESCIVKLDCVIPFVILSLKDFELIQFKLEKYDESLNEDLPQVDYNSSETLNHYSFDKDLISDLCISLKSNMCFTEKHRHFGVKSNYICYAIDFKAVLLTGLKGIGKTSAVNYLNIILQSDADCFACNLFIFIKDTQLIHCRNLKDSSVSNIYETLMDKFLQAAWCSPSVIVLEDLDHLCPEEEVIHLSLLLLAV